VRRIDDEISRPLPEKNEGGGKMVRLGKLSWGVFVLAALLSISLVTSPAFAQKAKKPTKSAAADPADKLAKANAAFDVNKMGDMSDFDPANPITPTGDTIKIALIASFSGPAQFTAQIFYLSVQWAAHDINKRGGIWVDGKKKLVEVIKADHMSKAEQCKKITERMILQEKVHAVWGTDGSNMQKIINEVAKKYKVISINAAGMADEVMDATNFSRYSFMTNFSCDQIARAMAYYYGQVRKKERKFYILCQDYSFGHALADGFKKGLKEYYPEAQIVGEDYHKLFLTDYAPYLTKVKASGAEAIYTGDWVPDAANLLKQARQMGLKIPFAHFFLDLPNFLIEIGVEGTKDLVQISQFANEGAAFNNPDAVKYYKTWNNVWRTKWKTAPYDSRHFAHGVGNIGSFAMQTYWYLSVVERAKTTDPEKIIEIWENDSYRIVTGKVLKMRACDHKVIQHLTAANFVPPELQKASFNMPPYYWYKEFSYYGSFYKIPADKVLPLMDQKLDRCARKNDWGE
jgi:branched-chain amino acid transport system substrate-binding protein